LVRRGELLAGWRGYWGMSVFFWWNLARNKPRTKTGVVSRGGGAHGYEDGGDRAARRSQHCHWAVALHQDGRGHRRNRGHDRPSRKVRPRVQRVLGAVPHSRRGE